MTSATNVRTMAEMQATSQSHAAVQRAFRVWSFDRRERKGVIAAGYPEFIEKCKFLLLFLLNSERPTLSYSQELEVVSINKSNCPNSKVTVSQFVRNGQECKPIGEINSTHSFRLNDLILGIYITDILVMCMKKYNVEKIIFYKNTAL